MQIAFEDRTPLRGDFVLRAVQRFDLTPIPSTLELTMRADTTLGGRVKAGSLLLAGSTLDRYRVLKVRRGTSEWVQGSTGGPADVLDVTAILDGVAALASPLVRAVIKEHRSAGEIYRSCGATAPVSADVPVARFTCLAGQFPTASIAQIMQEEGVVPVWTARASLAFKRLSDLFAGAPVESIAADTTLAVESPFIEQQEIPWALSTAPDGSVIQGRREGARAHVYLPRTPARVLDNIGRCLVVRRTLNGTFAGHIRAGDGFDVAGVRHVVATVAHAWENGSGGGSPDQSSRLWLAQLQR